MIMGYIIVKNFYRYPDGREVLEKHLYFPEERDIMELRKKTNWVKGSHGHFAGSVPTGGGGGSAKMSKQERARVSSAIATNFPNLKADGKQRKFRYGNYKYKFSVVEFGLYDFHEKKKLE